MRTSLITLAVLLFIIGGCKKDIQRCGGPDPLKTLPWLNTEVSKLSGSTDCVNISRSIYRESTVFIFSQCNSSSANSVPTLYDCEGRILTLSPSEYNDLKFTGEIELIWTNK